MYLNNDTKTQLRLNQNAQRWIGKKVPSFTFNTKKCPTKVDVMYSTCKANVSHLDENVATLWVWLNPSKSDNVRTNAFSTSTKCKSHGKNIFLFVGHHCRDATRRWG